MLTSLKSKAFSLLPPASLIVLNIFLFGAATVYQGNTSEFRSDFIEILKFYSLPILISLSILLGIGILLSKKYLSIYVSLIFALGVVLWIQGNILVWEYGVFDGDSIEWSKYSWQGWIDTGLWILLLTSAFILHKKIFCISSFSSLALILLQCSFLIFTYVSAPEKLTSNFSIVEERGVPEGLSNYSSSFNIVHVILDSFQTDVFQEIVKENMMESDFDGFILFRENMGVADNTILSLPAIFSGEAYQGNIEQSVYYTKATFENGFQNILFNEGYDVNLIPAIFMPVKNYTNYYRIRRLHGGSKIENDIVEAATLMDLILFRHLPHYLKSSGYYNRWRIQYVVTINKVKKYKLGQFHYKEFFQEYIDNVQVNSDHSAYHFIHLLPPHAPYVTDDNCNYTGNIRPEGRENYKVEAKCILRLFVRFIEKLKSLDIYDSSLIVLQADTGKAFGNIFDIVTVKKDLSFDKDILQSMSKSLALLAIKPPNKKGIMTVSDAKTTHTDIAPTIMTIAGLKHQFEGVSVFEIDPSKDRERRYSIIGIEKKYKVTGSVYDYQAWEEINYMPILRIPVKPYVWGSMIQFGWGGNSRPYHLDGWGGDEDVYVPTIEKNAVLKIPLDKIPQSSSLIKLKATLKPFLYPKQNVNILINGKKAGEWVVTNPDLQEYSLTMPSAFLAASDLMKITFNTPHGISTAGKSFHGIAMHSLILLELPVPIDNSEGS